jgi:hypothetical protein
LKDLRRVDDNKKWKIEIIFGCNDDDFSTLRIMLFWMDENLLKVWKQWKKNKGVSPTKKKEKGSFFFF